MYKIEIEERAIKGITKLSKKGGRQFLLRLERIVEELEKHPKYGIGKPEQLKHNLSGYWYRRIDYKNRIVYKIVEETAVVIITSVTGHYN